ncbi:hypothetical protein PIB30_074709 [Stylosanthes scabra]|uniref:Uncharacterized protein n=1 Tax=Stylosanthes scabra TaxID=79078 RepID=A0ABU6ZNF1_9FABA|nr:hypothetical protein [Stylosanthes scabra]
MPPLAEDGRVCSGRISGRRVRACPRAGGRICSRAKTMLTRRLSTVDMRTFQRGLGPRIRGGWPRATRTRRRLLLRHGYQASSVHPTRRGLQFRIPPHPPSGGPSSQFSRYGPPNDMYDVFSCGEQTMDHIAHEFIAARTSADAVYRLGPPLQPHHDPAQQSLAAVVPSSFTVAAVSAALSLFPVVLPVVTSAGLSVAFIGSAALPAPVQLSDTVALATALSECGTTFAPPTAARRLSAHGHSGHRGIVIRPHAAHHPISTIAQRAGATGTRQRDISDLVFSLSSMYLWSLCTFL